MDLEMKLNFADEYCFGPTIQGEGKFMGIPSMFIRLSGCPLRCCWLNKDRSLSYCDTSYCSYTPEKNKRTLRETLLTVSHNKIKHIVISGGEPYYQKIKQLVNRLHNMGYFITVETAGISYQKTKADYISISPKLSNSSNHPKFGKKHDKKRLNIKVLSKFIRNHDCQLKFIFTKKQDISEIIKLRNNLIKLLNDKKYNKGFFNNIIYLMPQGISNDELQESAKIAIKYCTKYNWKYSDRLHIRIYGNIQGV